jgi:hypothetical protein
MVKVLWFQQGGVHPAGKHRRHTELCQSFDAPAVGEVSPLTIPVLALLSRSYVRLTGSLGQTSSHHPVKKAHQNIVSFIWISAGAGYCTFRAAARHDRRVGRLCAGFRTAGYDRPAVTLWAGAGAISLRLRSRKKSLEPMSGIGGAKRTRALGKLRTPKIIIVFQ